MKELKKIPPQVLIIFDPKEGIKIKMYEGMETVSLTLLEKAGFQLHSASMRHKATMAHRKPTPRVAAWDNSHEPSSQPAQEATA